MLSWYDNLGMQKQPLTLSCSADKNHHIQFADLYIRIKVRGHNMFWGVDADVQPWVKALSKQDLLSAIDTRIKGITGHTKGL